MKTTILLSLTLTLALSAQSPPPLPSANKPDAVLQQRINEIKARQLAQSLQPGLATLKPGPLTNLPTFAESAAANTNQLTGTFTEHQGPTKMSIPIGPNAIILLNLRNGSVELPKDVPLDDVAVGFWQAVAHAFPYAFDWEAMCSERSLWTNQPVNAPVKQKVLD